VSGLREQPALGAFSLVLVVLLAVPPLPARGGGGGTMLYHRWILSDHLGSASVVLEAYPLEPQRPQGRAEREIVYAPFGRIHDDAGAVGTDSEVYAGHPREPATNLHYMQARWQNPETGSFLSVDPLISIASDPQSYNGYSYARNNSISITDPTGMCYIGGECPIYNQGWYFVGYEAGLQTWVTYADARGFEPDPFGGIPWTAYQDGRLIDAVASQFRSGQAHVVWALFMGVGGGATSAVAGGSHGVEFAGPGAPRSLEEIRALDDWGLEPLDPIDPELVELYEQLLIVIPAEGAAAAAAKAATRGAPLVRSTTQLAPKVDDVARNAAEWLGRDSRVIRNPAGDKVFVSKDGLRRIRFDINRPHPHQSPHMHVEEQVNGRWVKSGPIFPRDVAPR
jgi:RHS repeat-associated protein